MFSIPGSDHTAAMLRADVSAARKAWIERAPTSEDHEQRGKSKFLGDEDEDGRTADFHALRHTYITNLARSGIHPKIAQALARHCTIALTMNRYTHTVLTEQADAVNALPDLQVPSQSRQETSAVAMGADNQPEHVVPNVLPNPCISVPSAASRCSEKEVGAGNAKGPENGLSAANFNVLQQSAEQRRRDSVVPSPHAISDDLAARTQPLKIQQVTRLPIPAVRSYHVLTNSANRVLDVHNMCTNSLWLA